MEKVEYCNSFANMVQLICGSQSTVDSMRSCIATSYRQYTLYDPAFVMVTMGDSTVSGSLVSDSGGVVAFVIDAGKKKKCITMSVAIVLRPDTSDTQRSQLPDATTNSSTDFITLGITSDNDEIVASFERAASYWNNIIRATQAFTWELSSDLDLSYDCGLDSVVPNGTYRGLYIAATVEDIDGDGGVLGQSGPCYLLYASKKIYYPAIGVMQFDTADMEKMLSDGSLDRVILHEMGHVLGLGTLWSPYLSGSRSDPVFTGKNARKAYKELGGEESKVPIEALGGSGTAYSHWRESVFEGELMTGLLSGESRISTLTIQALKDIGYSVNASYAENYVLPSELDKLARRLTKDGHHKNHHKHSLGDDTLSLHFAKVISHKGELLGDYELVRHKVSTATEDDYSD